MQDLPDHHLPDAHGAEGRDISRRDIDRRRFLARLRDLAAIGAVAGVALPAIASCHSQRAVEPNAGSRFPDPGLGTAPLRDRAAARGLIFGAAAHSWVLADDPAFAARLVEECEMLVPEDELKWGTLRPSMDTFDFSGGDWLAEFARARGMRMRGHTLLWHRELPDWFAAAVNPFNARRLLEEHVRTVVGRYAARMHSWDVVNEGVEPADGRADGLRRTPWLLSVGPSYVDRAVRVAHEADPRALLVLNEYGMEYDTPAGDAKRDAVLQLLRQLAAAGTPVHALGMQSHLRAERPVNARKLTPFLRAVRDLGLAVLITELDVADAALPADVPTRDRAVADAYADYLDAVLAEPAVRAVLTWGLSDRYSWLSRYAPRPDGAPVRPLPLDADGNEKPAWAAIARAFDAAPVR